MPIHVTIATASNSATQPSADGLGASAERPLVSVIIPCYKQAQYLPAAIESVLNQTYKNFEIIVVDDGSPDETAAVAGKYSAVKYLHQPNAGSAAARNTGWKACTGTYVLFLDADDLLLKNALALGVRSLNEHKDAALAFGRCQVVFAGTELGHTQEPQPTTDFYIEMLRRCLVWHPAAMMCRRSIFESGITFDESILIGSDYDFYLNVTRQYPIYCHNGVTSRYVQHAANKSYNLSRALKSTLAILKRQKPHLKKPEHLKAYAAGIDCAYDLIGHKLLDEIATRKDAHLEKERVMAAAKAICQDPRALPRVLKVFRQAEKDGRIVCDRNLVLRVLRSLV